MVWRKLSLTITPPLFAVLALDATSAMAQQTNAQREPGLGTQPAASEARERELQRRIERLERRLDELNAAQPRSVPAAPQSGQSMPRPAQPATPPAAGQPSRTAASRPGSFEVDEDAAQRALERTLTESGSLLLPRGAISVTPGIGYSRVERDTPVIANIVDPATGATGVAFGTSTLRRNEFVARVDVRAGLPMESQLEIGVPFQYVRSSRRDSFGGDAGDNGSGAGDVTIGLAKTFLREKGAIPDVIGRISYNTGSGRSSDGLVDLGGGYRQLIGEVVALKRQDPLAFFATASYAYVFEKDGIKPGAVANLSFGTVLAASPATSLQFGFTQTYRPKQEANGIKIPGSDQTYGILNIGASSVLSRDVMLIVSVGAGVGNDAPKYSFNVSLPILFR